MVSLVLKPAKVGVRRCLLETDSTLTVAQADRASPRDSALLEHAVLHNHVDTRVARRSSGERQDEHHKHRKYKAPSPKLGVGV